MEKKIKEFNLSSDITTAKPFDTSAAEIPKLWVICDKAIEENG